MNQVEWNLQALQLCIRPVIATKDLYTLYSAFRLSLHYLSSNVSFVLLKKSVHFKNVYIIKIPGILILVSLHFVCFLSYGGLFNILQIFLDVTSVTPHFTNYRYSGTLGVQLRVCITKHGIYTVYFVKLYM